MSHRKHLKLIPLTLTLLILLVGEKTVARQKSVPQDKALYDKAFIIEYLASTLEDSLFNDCSRDVKEHIKRQFAQQALPYYRTLIDSFPTSTLLFAAMSAKANIEEEIGQVAEAKRTFLKILHTPDNIENGDISGVVLFPLPPANYKAEAAMSLAQYDINDSNFTDAIRNLDIANACSTECFCGNEAIIDELSLIEMYKECYFSLKDTQGFLRVILPYVINNRMAIATEHVALAYTILLNKHSKQDLKKNYLRAFRNRYTDNTEKNLRQKYFVNFVGHKIAISEEMLTAYKDTPFYQLLNE